VSLWIKICGNTSLADTQLAAEAGADAVGFVFAPSPRRVTASQVAAIVPYLPDAVEKIGVFVDVAFDEIAATVEAASLTGVQLHFDAKPDLPSQLRQRFGAVLRIIRVLHFDNLTDQRFAIADNETGVDAILIDSRTIQAAGGTGVAYDWSAAARTLFRSAKARKCIAAGGLTPENVAEAIAVLKPWGVDVVSGVESSPGKKDRDKVKAFTANARAAGIK